MLGSGRLVGMSLTRLLVALVLALAARIAPAAPPDSLSKLDKQHPRLFLHRPDIAALRHGVKNDPLMKQWHEKLLADATRMLNEKPVVHRLIGPRLLDQSRLALRRISTLSAMYLIDQDRRFADRAVREMLTAAGFEDWNPSHFLDVAEMTNALGIGYDWLYDYLSPQDRKTIRDAIVRLGLKPGLAAFEKRTSWTRATHNWSNVCNGGLTVGSLAIADEEPQIAANLFAKCAAAIRPSMKAYAPDGGFPEGPGYWSYATRYNAFYLGALESALGTDLDLKQCPGFAQTGFFRINCVSPTGKTFNYADAGEGAGGAPEMLYLGKIFNEPAFVAHGLETVRNRPGIFDLIWYSQLPPALRPGKSDRPLPLDAVYKGVNVAFFRSARNDPKALWVGIKGGDNRANHSHLDLGSFVLDALGHRWAVDLGGDDYNLPAYFGKNRWTYYRLRTESHNTITLDSENQDPRADAPIIDFFSDPDRQRSQVVIDLSNAYRAKATKVMRGLAFNPRFVTVQDEITATEPVDIAWNFLTPAQIKLDENARVARLTQATETVNLVIQGPENAKFEVISADPPPPQRQQPNIHNLRLRLSEKTKQTQIIVVIQLDEPRPLMLRVRNLSDWPKNHP